MADSWLTQEKLVRAWEVIDKLLTCEEYNERVYCLAMQYWGERGDVARVARCFSELSCELADLGLKPSQKAVKVKVLHLYNGQ